ncbi:MAG: GAF domain-containing protein, partial [Ornithinimicrobium sp.]
MFEQKFGTSHHQMSLSQHASELYSDDRLTPMLRQLIKTSCGLAGAVGGSISIVDSHKGRYTKASEVGTACRLGQSFPLHEGVTGQVVDRRAPVVLSSYREVSTGHLSSGHPAWNGSVAALPIWWRDDIVAVNVIFIGVQRSLAVSEVDHLEVVTQVVAPGMVTAMHRELPTLAASWRENRERTSIEPGTPASVQQVVQGLVSLAEQVLPGHDL